MEQHNDERISKRTIGTGAKHAQLAFLRSLNKTGKAAFYKPACPPAKLKILNTPHYWKRHKRSLANPLP